MYWPPSVPEDRAGVLEAFVAADPLGARVASVAMGLVAYHIPMRVAGWCRLRVAARACRAGERVPESGSEWRSVLVLFSGADRCIMPSWYPSTQAARDVVPTWNYAAVPAHGAIRFIPDRA
jgi:transcriptional regulator